MGTLSFVLLMIAILIGVRWNFTEVLIFHFPNDEWCWAHFHVSIGLFFFFFFFFLGLHQWHMEVPRLSVELELQLLAYTSATAMPDLSHVCDLHHSSWNARFLTQWARPRIKPASSWILVEFVTAEPQWELSSEFQHDNLVWNLAFEHVLVNNQSMKLFSKSYIYWYMYICYLCTYFMVNISIW